MPRSLPLRLLIRSATLLASLLSVIAVVLSPLDAQAATITVSGGCTLPDAISAANTDAAVGSCTAGSGSDTLQLTAPTYLLATGPFVPDGANATPSITSTITIKGNGTGATIERGGADPYRLFHVASTGNLTLDNVTLRNGFAQDTGGNSDLAGAIYNLGVVTLLNSHVISNTSERDGGAIYSEVGAELTILNSEFVSNTAGTIDPVSPSGGAIYSNGTLSITDSAILSNTARYGGGLLIDSQSIATLDNVTIAHNHALQHGGAFYTFDGVTVTVTNSLIANNESSIRAGGIGMDDSSQLFMTNSKVMSNTAGFGGGGLYNRRGSMTTLDNVLIQNNVSFSTGGGIENNQSIITLTNSSIVSNTAEFNGGGIYNILDSQLTISNTDILSNTGVLGGGLANDGAATLDNTTIAYNRFALGAGIYNAGGITVTNSLISSNKSTTDGGGFLNDSVGVATLENTEVFSNSASRGGGIYNTISSAMNLTDIEIYANVAISQGGGIFNDGEIDGTGVKLLDNRADLSGGAVYHRAGETNITQGCIVGNTPTAVDYQSGTIINAINNWWGLLDGPGGDGPGTGDSVSEDVTFAPFLTSAILDCPTVELVTFGKSASPSGTLLPGQPLTYTLSVTNSSALTLTNLVVNEPLPADFQLTKVISAGAEIDAVGNNFVIAELVPEQIATLQFVGKVAPTVSSALTLSNTATLSNSLTGLLSASASNNVVVPSVAWSSATYSTVAGNGNFTATVILSSPNPYAAVTVQTVVDSAVSTLTVPANSTSQPVLIAISEAGNFPRTVPLTLQSPVGSALGTPSAATLTINAAPKRTLHLPITRK